MSNNMSMDRTYLILRFTYGLVPIIAGADKFFNLLTQWANYIPEPISAALPMSAGAFMMLIGCIEIFAGLLVLVFAPRLGALVVSAWLVLLAVSLILGGKFDVAVRDLVMAVGAYSFAQLAASRGEKIIPTQKEMNVVST